MTTTTMSSSSSGNRSPYSYSKRINNNNNNKSMMLFVHGFIVGCIFTTTLNLIVTSTSTTIATISINNNDIPTTKTQQQPSQQQQQQQQQRSRRRRRRLLEFVHIPKTGGTMIERQAIKENVIWGWTYRLPKYSNLLSIIQNNITYGPPRVNFWHWPSYYFDYIVDFPVEKNPYKPNKDLFVVVRNPYDRLLSEYYFLNKPLKNQRKKKNPTTKKIITTTTTNSSSPFYFETTHMWNEWINTYLNRVITSLKQYDNNKTILLQNYLMKKNKKKRERFDYFIWDGHLIPQIDYVYDYFNNNNNNDNNNKVIQHILKYETLHEEFPLLMKKYNLSSIKLVAKNNNNNNKNKKDNIRDRYANFNYYSNKKLSIHNLTQSNLDLVNEVYKQDFEEFGYTIIDQV